MGTNRIPLLSSCVVWRLLNPQVGRTNQAMLTHLSIASFPSQLEWVNRAELAVTFKRKTFL